MKMAGSILAFKFLEFDFSQTLNPFLNSSKIKEKFCKIEILLNH